MNASPERKVGGTGQKPREALLQNPSPGETQTVEEEKSEKKDGRIETTMADLGERLPIGILDTEGRLHKDIVLKKWRTSDERALGKKKKKDMSMPDYVALVVSEMCSRLGPHNMDAMKDDAEKRLVVSQMYMGDVFFAYCLIRMRSMGDKLKLTITCPTPRCGVEFPWVGDLQSLDVAMVEEIDDILWQFELKHPFEMRKKTVTKFSLASPKWVTLENVDDPNNEADTKLKTLLGSIVGINDEDEPVQLVAAELDDLEKIDFEDLIASINDRYLGPNMAIEGTCTPEVCKKFGGDKQFMRMIDWRYDSFFGGSSR